METSIAWSLSHSGQGPESTRRRRLPWNPRVALKDGCELTERAMPSLLNDNVSVPRNVEWD